MAIIIVGDAEEILPQARPFAEKIEIFDTDGKPKDVAEFNAERSEENVQVGGKWKLVLDFQGQQLPVSLNLEQNASSISGELETMLGNGKITSGKVKGAKVSATATAEMQGNTVEFVINGQLDGDTLTGTISSPLVPAPLPFSGTRKEAHTA